MGDETVRLDECEGTLRFGVPPDLREPGGAWVELRRYLPRALQRDLDWEDAQITRDVQDHPESVFTEADGSLTRRMTREQWERREIYYRRLAQARIARWSYQDPDTHETVPVTLEAFEHEAIPSIHVTAIFQACQTLAQPLSDEAAFRLRQESVQRAHGNGAGTNGAGHPGEVFPHDSVVAASGPALPPGG